jgi:hypothetical protein
MWGYPEFYIPVPGGYGTETHGHLLGAGASQRHRNQSSHTHAPPPAAVEGA